jgi:septum formation topological specificity factor MinE
VQVDPDDVQVKLERNGESSILEIDVTMPLVKRPVHV